MSDRTGGVNMNDDIIKGLDELERWVQQVEWRLAGSPKRYVDAPNPRQAIRQIREAISRRGNARTEG